MRNSKAQTGQIFMSYSRSDRLAVDRLFGDLRKHNYSLWMDVDERGIEPGDDWRQELVKQMTASQAVIACISPDFLSSPNCQGEIARAQQLGKAIFPVILRRLDKDQSLATVHLDNVQFVDLAQNYEAGLNRLMTVLPRPRFPAQTIVRRAAAIIGLLGVLVLLFFGVMVAARNGTYVAPTPAPPTPTEHFAGNEIGVVVSYFVLPNGASQKNSAAATSLIEGFSNALKSELNSVQDGASQPIAIHVIGPQGVSPVVGADSQTRLVNAGVLAQQRDAAVVVYGLINLDSTTNQFEVQPEFYVAPGRHFADAQDIIGGYALGKQIRIDPGADVQTQFSARIKALAYVIEGMSQHVLRNYDQALAAFQAALAVPGWTEQEGQDILHTLIGSSHMRLAEKAASACKRDGVLQEVATAQTEFKASQTMNPKYARAYAGLANAEYISALWSAKEMDGCVKQLIDVNLLNTALDYIGQAQNADPATDPATVKNLLLNEAQIRFAVWLRKDSTRTASQDDSLYNAFLHTTDQIIANYDNRAGISVAYPVMEAYILRGVGRQTRGGTHPEEFRAAIDEYENALTIYNDANFTSLFSPARAMAVYGLEGDCYLKLADYTNADKYYTQALKIAKDLGNQAAIDSYKTRQKNLDAKRLTTATPESF